jgi:hypothetical protein
VKVEGGAARFQTQPHIFFSKLLTLKSGDAACSEQLLHFCQKGFAETCKSWEHKVDSLSFFFST